MFGKSKIVDNKKISLNQSKYLLKQFINGKKSKNEIIKLKENKIFNKKKYSCVQIN
jgi:hypothetical protein